MGNKNGTPSRRTSEASVATPSAPAAGGGFGGDSLYQVMSFKKRRGAVKKAYRGRMKIAISVSNPKASKSTINVHINSAKDLEVTTKSADAYVKLEITPEVPGCSAQKTKVIKGTKKPAFGEDFQFAIERKKVDLTAHRLVFHVRNQKPDGRTEMVGAFSFALDEVFEPELDGWSAGGGIDSWFKIFDAQKGQTMHMRHVERQKESKKSLNFKIGDRVWVEGKGAGKVAFVGPHHENGTDRIGVILDTAMGKNNGTVGGHKYFECAENHGSLVAPFDKKGKPNVSHETAATAPSATAGDDDGMYADPSKFEGVIVEQPVTPKKRGTNRGKKLKDTDFKYLKVLGRGSFGKVFLAEKAGSDERFAVKVLKKTVVVDDDDVFGTMIEKRTLELSEGCQFITKLHGAFQSKANLFFVMEFVNGGDLMYWIMAKQKFSEPLSRFYCAEILVALWYLHDNGVIYRDLKLDNVLVSSTGHVKLTDFGLSKENIFGQMQTTTFCGTPTYLAPEILHEQPYGHSVDFWSLGVLAHEFLVGESPFDSPDDDQLFSQIKSKKVVLPKWVSSQAKSFVMALLQRDPANRLGCSKDGKRIIEQHPFFKPIDWKKLANGQVKPPFVPPVKNPKEAEMFDPDFVNELPNITPQDMFKVSMLDADDFKGFSFINQTGAFGNKRGQSMKKKAMNKSDLRKYKWYASDLTRQEIQQKLAGKPVGTFCIRESKTKPGCYALAVAVDQTGGDSPTYMGLITPKPDPKGGTKYALISAVKFSSVPELVDFYKLNAIPYGDQTTMLTEALV